MIGLTKSGRHRLLCLTLCLSVLFAAMPAPVYAQEDALTGGLCPHHTVHTEDCGYLAAQAEVPCSKACAGTDGTGAAVHEDGCAYVPAVEGKPCGYACESCVAQQAGAQSEAENGGEENVGAFPVQGEPSDDTDLKAGPAKQPPSGGSGLDTETAEQTPSGGSGPDTETAEQPPPGGADLDAACSACGGAHKDEECPVEAMRSALDALPDVEALGKLDEEALGAAYEALLAAREDYEKLSGEQKALLAIDEDVVFGARLAFFEEPAAALADKAAGAALLTASADLALVASVEVNGVQSGYSTGATYRTPKEALTAAWKEAVTNSSPESPATVTLMQSVDLLNDNLTVTAGSGITLEMAQNVTLSANCSSSNMSNGVINVSGGSFTLGSGTVSNSKNQGIGIFVDGGSFTLAGGAIRNATKQSRGVYIKSGGALISGGEISVNSVSEDSNSHWYSYGIVISGEVEITGGTIRLEGTGFGCGVTINEKGSVAISGGEILAGATYGGTGVNNAGSVTVTGGRISGTSCGLISSSSAAAVLSGGSFSGGEKSVCVVSGNVGGLLAENASYYAVQDEGDPVRIDDPNELLYKELKAEKGYGAVIVEGTSKVSPGEVNPVEIISVDITWGAMDFTYTSGLWDPKTHTYGAGGWSGGADAGKVTVANNGTVGAVASCAYEQVNDAVTASFTDENQNAIDGPLQVQAGRTEAAYLTLAGEPAKTLNGEKMGIVTVTIQTMKEGEEP